MLTYLMKRTRAWKDLELRAGIAEINAESIATSRDAWRNRALESERILDDTKSLLDKVLEDNARLNAEAAFHDAWKADAT